MALCRFKLWELKLNSLSPNLVHTSSLALATTQRNSDAEHGWCEEWWTCQKFFWHCFNRMQFTCFCLTSLQPNKSARPQCFLCITLPVNASWNIETASQQAHIGIVKVTTTETWTNISGLDVELHHAEASRFPSLLELIWSLELPCHVSQHSLKFQSELGNNLKQNKIEIDRITL